jgi:lipoprotein-anchoring transpeptidase ErfK/SrfK
MRILSLFLLLLLSAAAAEAGPRPRVSGDPRIDGQWIVQLKRMPAAPGAARAAFSPRRMARPAPARPAPPREMDPAFLPALVDFATAERPGTIVIDPRQRYLYLVLEGGRAQRYGVGVGRDGFGWSGTVRVGRKAEWPTWTPPAEMRKRQPYLPVSMAGGPGNPLGARALYLHEGGRDTLFRIHGSNEPWTIGRAVSSGCFRMRNEDVTELYARVGIGTKVVVL